MHPYLYWIVYADLHPSNIYNDFPLEFLISGSATSRVQTLQVVALKRIPIVMDEDGVLNFSF